MEQFLTDASTTHWWLGVVVVGITINIASTYIRAFFEHRLSRLSSYWRNRQESHVKEEQEKIELLKNNPELKLVYALNESRFRTRSVGFFVMSTMFTILSISFESDSFVWLSITFVLSLVCIIISLIDHREAVKIKIRIEKSTTDLEKIKK
ncbi:MULTISPECIES: hypothetical protein [unclassified Vibrio]|uniref:hypothetical protein n=1 Tax=unclassified Vibrio TaxID=2614977 RepID=UPI0013619679|nr:MULTISPECIES: hypothetical protein [unclassified Vibrio]NAW59666.1 hypothetical protein [Vibrio sp. V36_P2S2PM302]NAX26545.1 hypothetical protein [Vibrio sp. V38_P2S17PM301]